MTRPVVILSAPRSGSSLTAGLFAAHGFWTGDCKPADRFNAKGYFENRMIDDAITRLYPGRIYDRLEAMKPHPDWPEFIRGVHVWEGYRDGPWLVKSNSFTWPLWACLDPIFVFPRRDVASVVRSAQRYFPLQYRQRSWERIVRAHHAEEQKAKAQHGGFDIDTPRLLSGDYAQFRAALDACGVAFDEKAAREFIDPGLWNAA